MAATWTRDELLAFLDGHPQPRVSLFMPTQRGGTASQQNPIRFKNLLRQAEAALLARDLRPAQVREILEPAWQRLADDLYWRHQSDGLAAFLAHGTARFYRLPIAFDDLVVVNDRFHIKPLLPLLTGDGRFYVLALSQRQVRLLQGTRHHIGEIIPEGLPHNLAEAMQAVPTGVPARPPVITSIGKGGQVQDIYHGHGADIEDSKDLIFRYFRRIDEGLHTLLRTERAPLVLAGVEYYLPIYKEANTYPHLVDEVIPGNPEGIRDQELHRQAWALVEPIFQRARERAKAWYRQRAGTGQTSNDIAEILRAAHQGRVEFLFVTRGRPLWGVFDPASGTARLCSEASPETDDLLDVAAVETLRHGGAVFALEPAEMVDTCPAAATFRY